MAERKRVEEMSMVELFNDMAHNLAELNRKMAKREKCKACDGTGLARSSLSEHIDADDVCDECGGDGYELDEEGNKDACCSCSPKEYEPEGPVVEFRGKRYEVTDWKHCPEDRDAGLPECVEVGGWRCLDVAPGEDDGVDWNDRDVEEAFLMKADDDVLDHWHEREEREREAREEG